MWQQLSSLLFSERLEISGEATVMKSEIMTITDDEEMFGLCFTLFFPCVCHKIHF